MFMRRVDYLGYVVENDTIKPTERKTLAVVRFLKPTTVKAVQSFLSLTGYFRKFIPQYANIACPLLQLLKNSTRFWVGDAQLETFERLKRALVNEPVFK